MSTNNYGMDEYQQFIHKSRYARYLWDEKRRETWEETIDRYLKFFSEHLSENYNYTIDNKTYKEVRNSILNLKTMPSMRALMTAGDALKNENLAGYNCAYIAIDKVRSFDEILYVLMNGTGVGFSVERQYVNKLPEISEEFHSTDTIIIVRDSKLGWAKAFKELISLLYAGQVPKYDLSRLRPAGAPLKTFGGRSSGPEPLRELFEFTINLFKNASGRKLSSIECHDLVCKIASVVVVGGVRRSALISLSNLSDDRMRSAKSGEWWHANSQRRLSNNSAAYTEKPDIGIFMKEWLSLYESKSGERGIFNREACKKIVEKLGDRRDANYEWGTNPSLRAGTKVWTTDGIAPIEELEDKKFYVRNLNGEISNAKCWLSGKNKPLWKIVLTGGHEIYATAEHKWPVWDKTQKKYVKITTDKLKSGDYFPVLKFDSISDKTKGSSDDGFVIGWNLGDGWITERETGKQIGFIVSDDDKKSNIHNKISNYLKENCEWSGNFDDKNEINVNNNYLRDIFEDFQVSHKKNGLPKSVWDSVSDDFIAGLIDGLFSSDGCFSDRIQLSSSNEQLIRDVSEILGFYGIKSCINIQHTKNVKFPNGKEYDKEYYRYELRIKEQSSIVHFHKLFSLSHKEKQDKLNQLVSDKKSNLENKIRIQDVFLTDLKEDVWDISVQDETHCFQIAHCITGNCSEIILRNRELCNLSEVVCRQNDTLETLKEKVRIATILGTWQSTLTNFKYVSTDWKRNCDEERLLGVSLTGIMDCELFKFDKHSSSDPYPHRVGNILNELRQVAIEINKEWATKLGINPSAAITCVKPSGTVSQLVDSGSGIHTRHSPYYIRTVRADKKDPLAKFMKDNGFPAEDDLMSPDNTYVFSFPIKCPDGATFRNDLSAIDQLTIWKIFQEFWCEHKPSITVSVKEDEWLDVGAWVYENFDYMSGVSFLPYDGGTYRQAPYQECDEEYYNEFLEKMPKDVDWTKLSEYENTDQTTGAQELACSAGACEVVDFVK